MGAVVLKDVRIAFPVLHTPEQFKGEGAERYSASFPIAPGSENEKAIEAAMVAAAVGKWGDKGKAILADLVKKGKVCFVKAPKTKANGDVYNGFEDMHSLSTSRSADQGPPKVLDRDGSPLGKSSGKPYSGCNVYAQLDIYAQDNSFGRRINATLVKVQFYKDNDAFVGGTRPTDDALVPVDNGADDDTPF